MSFCMIPPLPGRLGGLFLHDSLSSWEASRPLSCMIPSNNDQKGGITGYIRHLGVYHRVYNREATYPPRGVPQGVQQGTYTPPRYIPGCTTGCI